MTPLHSDNVKHGKELIPLAEMLESHKKWWDERVKQAQEAEGWEGRDLRIQTTLLSMVLGMEQDITFLLRYVRQLTLQLELNDLAENSPEAKDE